MAIGIPIQRVFFEVSTTDSVTVDFDTSPTTGTKLILMVTTGELNPVLGVTDTQGNTWAFDGTASSPAFTLNLYECQVRNPLVAGVDDFTITFTSATTQDCVIWVQEVSGLVATTAFDAFASGSGSGAAMATASTSMLTQADEYVQAGFRNAAGTSGSGTRGAAFADVATPISTMFPGSCCEYAIVSASTALAADYTLNPSYLPSTLIYPTNRIYPDAGEPDGWGGIIGTWKGASDDAEDFAPRRGGMRR